MFVCCVKSETYHIEDTYTYFHSVDLGASGYAHINFDTSILPLHFTTLYRDANQRVHFNNTWIKTNVNISLTSWFTGDWLNYTSSSGTQQFYVTKPEEVYFDDVKQTEGTTWSYSDYVLTINPTGTSVGATWTAGSESEYSNPTVTSSTYWYCRADTQTVNTVLGYKLSETESSTQKSVTQAVATNVTTYFGWRVWKVNSKGEETELTSGYQYSWRVADGEGIQNILWNAPTTSLQIGYDAIKVVLYVKLTATGPWQPKATFISSKLLEKTLVASEWAFQTYTKKVYSGGSTTATVFWGASAKESSIAGIEFENPDVYENMQYKLQTGDFVGFVLYPYLNLVGNLFYGLLMLMVCVPTYNRYKSVTPLLVLLIIFGGAAGIFTLLIPEAGMGLGWIIFLIGLGGLLYKVFR